MNFFFNSKFIDVTTAFSVSVWYCFLQVIASRNRRNLRCIGRPLRNKFFWEFKKLILKDVKVPFKNAELWGSDITTLFLIVYPRKVIDLNQLFCCLMVDYSYLWHQYLLMFIITYHLLDLIIFANSSIIDVSECFKKFYYLWLFERQLTISDYKKNWDSCL